MNKAIKHLNLQFRYRYPHCFLYLPKSMPCNGLYLRRRSFSCIIFLLTMFQIINCLNEWELGYQVMIPFTGDRYDSVHKAMVSLIDELEQHDYHGAKLKRLLKKIATDGWSV